MYKQGEILLIPIPFSDLSSNKKRPVLVISNDESVKGYIMDSVRDKVLKLMKG